MKVKLDENVPLELEESLTRLGHDVDTVPSEGLTGHPDAAVWTAAQAGERFFVTQDLDFSDLRRFAPGKHAGVLLIRLHAPSRRALIRLVSRAFAHQNVDSWTGAFVVLTESKIRVKRP